MELLPASSILRFSKINVLETHANPDRFFSGNKLEESNKDASCLGQHPTNFRKLFWSISQSA
jgi:hypothetical protein